MRFTEKLRQLRDRVGLSEARLAKASGVSFGAVHGYCIGTRQPSFGAVVRLARALGVSTAAFENCDDFADEEPPPPQDGRKPAGRKKGSTHA
jgi:transcriptional regulator with XRE-family HTH domain